MNKKRKTYEIQDSTSEPSKVAEAVSPYLLSDEFLATPEADFETATALENLLQRAQGFSLAFARVNMPAERNKLMAQIRQRFESRGIKIFEINLPSSTTDLLTEIFDQLKKQNFFRPEAPRADRFHRDATRQRIVFVYGIEHSILSSVTYHPTLAVLNYKRELFREKISAPVIFWLPEYALQAIAEGAADFWAWRSGVFEFATPRQESEKMWLAEQPKGDSIALSNLTREEKADRIESLSGLLSDYELLENKNDENIIAIRLDLLHRISELYSMTGDLDQALKLQTRAHQLAARFDLQWAIARSLHHSAKIHQARCDYDRALELYGKSLAIAEKIGDVDRVSRSYHQMGMVYHDRGDYDRALELYGKSLATFEKLGDIRGVSSSYHQMGMVYQARGDYDRALELYGKSLAILEKLGDISGVSRSYHQMGNVYYQRGDYDRALELYSKSLAILETLGDISGVSSSYHQMGMVYQDRGDYDRALELYGKSLATFEKLGDISGVASSRAQIGKLLMDQNKFEEAISYLISANQIFEKIGSPNVEIVAGWLDQIKEKLGEKKLLAIFKKKVKKD